MKLLKSLLGIFVIFSLLTITGCQSASSTGHKATQTKKSVTSFPVTIKDATGTSVTLKKQPDRIVSLVPSNTEIAFALNVGKHVVGVSDNGDYPAKVKSITKVGGMQLNTAKIISLKPDLVLAQEINDPKAIAQLRSAGITVFVVKNPSSLNGVYQSILTIGRLTGAEKQGKAINTHMKKTFQSIADKVKSLPKNKKKSVWVEISGPPEIYTTGKGTFMNELLNIIHAKNAAGGLTGYPKVSEEQAISYNPDAIVLGYGDQKTIKQVQNRAAWKNIPALKNHQIYTIDPNLISRPGPRLAEGAKQLAKDIYPGIFK